jgi:GAF domain-containing protein
MLTKANSGGVVLRDDQGKDLILRAGQDLSPDLEARIGHPVQDDLAQLVMNSQEPFLADGQGLQQFRPLQKDAGAVIYAPLVIQNQSVGVLWVSNIRLPFKDHQKDLLSALADYAAIAIVNARLFAAMEQRSRHLEQLNEELQAQAQLSATGGAEQAVGDAVALELIKSLRSPLYELRGDMNILRTGEAGPIPPGLQANVDVMHRKLTAAIEMLDSIVPPDTGP